MKLAIVHDWLTNMGVKHKQLQFELEKVLDVPNVIL